MFTLIRKSTKFNILNKRYFSKNPLGRWSIDKNLLETNTVIDWANHDHCGSESCKLEKKNDEKLDVKLTIKEKKIFKNNIEEKKK